MAKKLNIVSWQSKVLLGNVGNNLARCVYDFFGMPVTYLDTVLFSNIASRKTFGMIFDSRQWLDFFTNAFILLYESGKCNLLHTGFFGSHKQMQLLVDLLQRNQLACKLFVDPVMGDKGRAYVNWEVMDFFPHLLHYADVITPNVFELEVLAGKKIATIEAVQAAVTDILQLYPNLQAVVVTSVPDTGGRIAIAYMLRNKTFTQIKTLQSQGPSYGGCGDMFMSLLCAHYAQGNSLVKSIENALAQTWFVITQSHNNRLTSLEIRRYLPKFSAIADHNIFIEKEPMES